MSTDAWWMSRAKLMRLPLVFSAVTDGWAGVSLWFALGWTFDHSNFHYSVWIQILGITCTISALLYASGMVWNDFFDRDDDAQHRPDRPVPSGDVSPLEAVGWGLGLMIFAGAVAGMASLTAQLLTGLLIASIFFYDGPLKSTPLAPPLMGLCRALNLTLGMAIAQAYFDPTNTSFWNTILPITWVPAGSFLFITGITLFARNESRQSEVGKLKVALAVLFAGVLTYLIGLNSTICLLPSNAWLRTTKLVVSNGIILYALLPLIPVYRAALADPSPANVQKSVGKTLGSLIPISAALAMVGSPFVALGIILLAFPAGWLRKSIAVT